jgi:hypothetical protein
MKERLKAKAARSPDAPEAELKPDLDPITAKDAKGWFRHAGYALHRPEIRFNRDNLRSQPQEFDSQSGGPEDS